jgi:hypothetical protein
MAVNLKHVGRIKTNGRKCLVVFRTLPNDAFNCLIVQTENLSDSYHDSLINLVESPAAQNANEFAEVLARAVFSDGSTMLPSLHAKGNLVKVPTDMVEMLPNNSVAILLSELNQMIAEQQGISVQDLAVTDGKTKGEIKEIATAKDISPKDTSTDPVIDQGRTTSASVNDAVQELTVPPGTPDDVAKFYRSQADKLSKQAAEMRRKAEDLSPTKKKTAIKE